MRIGFLIMILVVTMACAPASHGFGILRYAYDAIANQLGLDRGPIPKVVPKPNPQDCPPQPHFPGKHPDADRIHIQAEGF